MIATNCQGCGTELTAGDSACSECGGLTGRPSEPSPAGQHSSGQAGTPMGEAAGPVTRQPYSLMDLSTWLTAMPAAMATVTLARLAVPGSNAASVAVDVVAVLLMLATGPVFLVWLYQARRNAEHSGYPQRRTAGWAVGAWFVPVSALWLPYQVVSDIWRAAQAPERRARIPWLVVTWWTCWLLAWATGYRYTGTARPFPHRLVPDHRRQALVHRRRHFADPDHPDGIQRSRVRPARAVDGL